jgi:hypothetical protein
LTGSNAQFPISDTIADKFIQKYQQSSCEQLWDRKGQPKSQKEQEAIQILRNDPDRRAAFINSVAAPIANKMFFHNPRYSFFNESSRSSADLIFPAADCSKEMSSSSLPSRKETKWLS